MDHKYYLNTTSQCVVAFLDILGFSAMIEENDTVKANSKGLVYNWGLIYDSIVSYFPKEIQDALGIKFLWVSDSIFITAKIENTSNLIEAVKTLVHQIFTSNLSVRGGIATGSLYFESNLWGTSVVRAVGLEKKAHTPRVIMTVDDYRKLSPYMDKNYWIQDGNYYYFNYFNSYFTDWISQGREAECILSVYAQCIKENFNRCNKDEHKSKWHYLAKELKRCIIENRDFIDNHCKYTKARAMASGIDIDKSNSDIYLSMFEDALTFMEREN